MVPQSGGPSEEDRLSSRPPTVDDLVALCRNLNEQGARYVIVGGMAMLHHGFTRATEDVDLLVDTDRANVAKVKRALLELPDRAVAGVNESDLDEFVVVRVADEITIDLMKSACGIEFAEAEPGIEWVNRDGVRIPFASRSLMLKLKRSVREKDRMDRDFLLAREAAGGGPVQGGPRSVRARIRAWLRWIEMKLLP